MNILWRHDSSKRIQRDRNLIEYPFHQVEVTFPHRAMKWMECSWKSWHLQWNPWWQIAPGSRLLLALNQKNTSVWWCHVPCLSVFWNVPLDCFLSVYLTNLWSCHTASCQQRMPRDMNRQRPTQSIDTGERLSMQKNWRANSHSINDDIIPVLELIVHWNAPPI